MIARALAVLAGVMLLAAPAFGAEGQALFDDNCSACHQKGGVGTPGLAPPLVSSVMTNAGLKQPDYVALVVLNGLSGRIVVSGQTYVSAMPAQPQLADADLAAIANYVLNDLNGRSGAEAVGAQTVAGLRATKMSHAQLRDMRAVLAQ